MSQDLEIAQAGIEAVARLVESELLIGSPFHLAACGGCGAPSFQQPCPICDYYPMGADKGTWHPKAATEDMFFHKVRNSGGPDHDGNLATWLLQSYKKTVSYGHGGSFKRSVDQAMQRALGMTLPESSLYWRLVVEEKQTVSRPDRSRIDLHRIWSVSGDFLQQVNSYSQQGILRPEDAEKARESVRSWADAAHSDDDAQVLEGIRRLRAAVVEVRRFRSNGNLSHDIERLDELEAEWAAKAAAPTI